MNREATPYLAEFLGTFGFVFIAASSIAVNNATDNSLGLAGIALANGLGLIAFVYAFSHVSGAHFNPAITISLWVTKKIEGSVAAVYIICQLLGAILAAALVEGFFGGAYQTIPRVITLDVFPTILLEAFLTFFLVLVFYGTLVDRRSHTSHGGLAIGLVFAALVLIGYELTGGVMNPAKAFGPAFIANFWNDQLVYWIGPIVGAVAAGLLYEYGVLRSKED